MRQSYLVAYDIRDDRRRDRVFHTLRGFGQHVQYSVFRCDLTPSEHIRLSARLLEAIHVQEDQVLFADLGPTEGRGRTAIRALGAPYDPPERGSIVI